MRFKTGLLLTALLGVTTVIAQVSAQVPQPTTPPTGGAPAAPPPAAGGGGRGGRGAAGAPDAPAQGGGRAGATFPAQQRPPADPAVVARGKGLYGVNCQLCHGVDLRGGDQGGPNLLRSAIVLDDKDGELIAPIIKNGQLKMPPINLPDADLNAIATYLHSVAATMAGQGGPPRGNPIPPNEAVLVGNVADGKAYFTAKCANCHSVTGDLQGVGGRYPDPRTLQTAWVGGTSGGGRGGGPGGGPGGGRGGANPVTVTLPSGQKVEGRVNRIDDFIVIVTLADGTQRSFARNGDVPKVEIRDPLKGHKDLLSVLTDKDMHDVTAYLASIK
jgi:cytochrome c oxidase cbb3-type subunit 3